MKFDNNKKLNVKDLVRGKIYKRIIQNCIEEYAITFFKYYSNSNGIIFTFSQLKGNEFNYNGRIVPSLGDIYEATKEEINKYYEEEMDSLIF